MTTIQFRNELQKKLKSNKLDVTLEHVQVNGVTLTLFFNKLNMKIVIWLNKFFPNGISLLKDDHTTVIVNSFFEKRINI